jgi:hypothetical protein
MEDTVVAESKDRSMIDGPDLDKQDRIIGHCIVAAHCIARPIILQSQPHFLPRSCP